MIEFLFFWLEVNGFRRVSKGIQYVTVSYMMFITGGLTLAVGLNGLALFIKFVLIPLVPAARA